MSGFSAEWLALREPADHCACNAELARKLAALFPGQVPIKVVDLGCGTGSNLRATSLQLGHEQHWTLVDHDPKLLVAARDRLTAWADTVEADGQRLALCKNGKRITVAFRHADLVAELEAILGEGTDLVTAAALFDLAAPSFIERTASAVAARGACFYTTLTYDGQQAWSPAHAADDAMRAAFNAHQHLDKGLMGPAAGPDGPAVLMAGFRARGYGVLEAPSPWTLGVEQGKLLAELAAGFAGAVSQTGRVPSASIAAWCSVLRVGAVVGHVDTLAAPPNRSFDGGLR